jgi:hypothetical protein
LDVLFVQVLIVYSFSYTLFFNKRTHEGGDMAEPASSVVAIAAATITLSGSVIGLQYDALLAGFFGGLLSLLYLPPMPALKIAGAGAGDRDGGATLFSLAAAARRFPAPGRRGGAGTGRPGLDPGRLAPPALPGAERVNVAWQADDGAPAILVQLC